MAAEVILGRGRWNADELRNVVRDYVLESLSDNDAVLVIDETGFLKQGKTSCGVGRQCTGSAGKITTCQIGVFAAYVSRKGHAFIDRALYLTEVLDGRFSPHGGGTCSVRVSAATKLARAMIERAVKVGGPFSWVAADRVYGVGEIEIALKRAGKG